MPRLDRHGSPVQKRRLDLQPEGVNRQDCLDDQRIQLPFQLSGFQANATLEAWASVSGVDCAIETNRIGVAPPCWKIVAGIPLLPQSTVDVPVRTILSGAVPAGEGDPADGRRACGRVDLTTLDLQVLYFAPGASATPAAMASVALRADTVGNPAPDGVKVLPGDRRAFVRWSPLVAPFVSTGMRVYCAPTSAGDAGTCSSESLPRTVPDADFDAQFGCAAVSMGDLSGWSFESTADGRPLDNGVSYAVAVASVDAFDNAGALSPVACVAPTADRESSGGETSSCSSSPAQSRGRGGLALVAAIAWVAVVARRRPAMRR